MNNKKVILISVCGGSGSGKTTIANSLAKKTNKDIKIIILSQDNFYICNKHLSFEKRSALNYDHPDAFDWELMEKIILNLLKGQSVEIPIYDYNNHCRSDKKVKIEASHIIIFEGIYSLYKTSINKLASLKIFVDTPSDERFIRRLKRDICLRNRSMESVINQWRMTVRPMYKQFIEKQKRDADIIIPWFTLNRLALKSIKHAVNSLINDFDNDFNDIKFED